MTKLATLLVLAAFSARAAQPTTSYSLEADVGNLSLVDVTLDIRHAPETFRLAMARHPEYDDASSATWKTCGWKAPRRPRSILSPRVSGKSRPPGGSSTVRYRIRLPAYSPGARGAWRPFLAPTGGLVGDLHMFLYMVEAPGALSHVTLRLPAGWTVATALAPTSDPHIFFASSAGALAESPILAGQLRNGVSPSTAPPTASPTGPFPMPHLSTSGRSPAGSRNWCAKRSRSSERPPGASTRS